MTAMSLTHTHTHAHTHNSRMDATVTLPKKKKLSGAERRKKKKEQRKLEAIERAKLKKKTLSGFRRVIHFRILKLIRYAQYDFGTRQHPTQLTVSG